MVSAHAPDCPSHVPQSGSLKSRHGARETGREGKEWWQGDGNYGMAEKGRWELFSDDFATLIRNVARNVARREPSVWVSACGPAHLLLGLPPELVLQFLRRGLRLMPRGQQIHSFGGRSECWVESSAFGAGDTASLYLEVPVVLEFCCHPRNKQSQTFAAPPGSLGHFAALEIYIPWRPARALDGAGCRGWGWGGGRRPLQTG